MQSNIRKPGNRSRLSDTLLAIRAKFVGSVDERLSVLAGAVAILGENPHEAEALGHLRRECHRIAGIAGSIGLHEEGALAAEIDGAIKSDPANWPVIKPMLEDLITRLADLQK